MLSWAQTVKLRTEGQPRLSLQIRFMDDSSKIPGFLTEWFNQTFVSSLKGLNSLSKQYSAPELSLTDWLKLPPVPTAVVSGSQESLPHRESHLSLTSSLSSLLCSLPKTKWESIFPPQILLLSVETVIRGDSVRGWRPLTFGSVHMRNSSPQFHDKQKPTF